MLKIDANRREEMLKECVGLTEQAVDICSFVRIFGGQMTIGNCPALLPGLMNESPEMQLRELLEQNWRKRAGIAISLIESYLCTRGVVRAASSVEIKEDLLMDAAKGLE